MVEEDSNQPAVPQQQHAAERDLLYKAFAEVSVAYTDVTGQFGVTPACPSCIDVSALVNYAINLNLEKLGAESAVDIKPEEEEALLHKVQWLLVVHYVENIVEQFHTNGVPFNLIIFENKAAAVPSARAALHAAVLAHLQHNTELNVQVVPSPHSEAWAHFVELKLPSMLITEYPKTMDTEYHTQCYANLWCLTHDAVPVVLFDHMENHNPRFTGYHLDPRALDTVDEHLTEAVRVLIKESVPAANIVMQDVAELHRLVPDGVNAAKTIALAGALAEADLKSPEERTIGALFFLQGLFTDALKLEDMCFRGVVLPTDASKTTQACPAIVTRLIEQMRLFPQHQDGLAPTHYDGKVLHTMLAYAHLPGSQPATIGSIAATFTVADELKACAGLIKQLNLEWLLPDTALAVEGCDAAVAAWRDTQSAVQAEAGTHGGDAALELHPVRQNALLADILLDDDHTEDLHTQDSLAIEKLRGNGATEWDDATFQRDRPMYVRFSNDDEEELTEEEIEKLNRHQQNEAFRNAVEAYIRLARNRRLIHERDARPLLEEAVRKAPGAWQRRLRSCLDRNHWAAALPVCLKARKAFDAARARQRLAAFNTKFAQTLLGQLQRMNLDAAPQEKQKAPKTAHCVRVFAREIVGGQKRLDAVKATLAELRDMAKKARTARTEKSIGDWFFKEKRLFEYDGKPVEETLMYEEDVLGISKPAPNAKQAIADFKKLRYREQLREYRAEAAVIAMEMHLLRLDCHLEEEESRAEAGTANEEDTMNHHDYDPCVLSKTDHLTVAVTNALLDLIEEMCDTSSKLHEHVLKLHPRVLSAMLQLHFEEDAKKVLKLLQAKFDVTTTLEGLESSRDLGIPSTTLIDFQLRAMGPYFQRPKGNPDERSPFFDPDDWQVELLDAVDARRSALISAPTSSGKTFISFYAMEKVLRARADLDDPKTKADADKQVIVYVSPTKALVNQTVAEIEGRYSKKMPRGQVLATAFTKEFGMEEYKSCQVLVTVPECLEHLLLMAGDEGWKHRIKWVILDEVHSVSLNEGFFWERLLTLIDCPFLALSATIGNTESFISWLEALERERLARRGGDVTQPLVKIRHHLRWNDLDTWCYDLDNSRMVTVNPLGVLSPAKLVLDGFPSGCRLLPEHAYELWSIASDIMKQRESLPAATRALLQPLDPSAWFVKHQPLAGDAEHGLCGRVRVKSYAEYEEQLKAKLTDLAREDRELLEELAAEVGDRIERPSRNMLADRDLQDGAHLLSFLRHMCNGPANRLPALLFHLDMAGIDRILESLHFALCREQDEHYYLHDVVGGSHSRLNEAHAKHLQEAREAVDRYMHELKEAVQHITDEKKREEELQARIDKETDRQLERLWGETYEEMNRKWLERTKAAAEAKARAYINQLIADGQLPRNEAAMRQQLEDDHVSAEVDRLSAERMRPFCLSELPVSLEDLADAFPKSNKQKMQRKLESSLFHQALRRGIGIHYPELTKDRRQAVERLFRDRKLAVVISTDTLALGISMPCRSVVFLGDNPALDSLNYHQMSGRAGRRGHDIRGHVVFYGISKHKIRRLLSSPLRQMFPNIPLDSSTAVRAMARFQEAKGTLKEKEGLSLRRLLLEPYATQDAERQAMLPVYMRAQLETLLRLNLLTFDTNPKLLAYREAKAEERRRLREEGEAEEAALLAAERAKEEEEKAKEEEAQEGEEVPDDWEALLGGDEDDEDDKDDDDTAESWEALANEAEEGGESAAEPDADDAQRVDADEEEEELELEEAADPDAPLAFAGPVVGRIGSMVSYLACHDPNNVWMAYLVRTGALSQFLSPTTEAERLTHDERSDRLELFRAILLSMPQPRVHPTEVHHTKRMFPDAQDVYLVQPALSDALHQAAVNFRAQVLDTFASILRLHGLRKAPAGAGVGLPLSKDKGQVGGSKGLPSDLQELKVCDPLRLPTAAVSGRGFGYDSVRELLLEIQRLPGLSADIVPIPACVDERQPHLLGIMYDIYRRGDLKTLLPQAKLHANTFYSSAALFHHNAKVLVEALRRRATPTTAATTDAAAEEEPGEATEDASRAATAEPATEGARLVGDLSTVVNDFYGALERVGLIWI
ncbi:hypothetical protein PTSG_02304 [Salpingoeca rosetta]|uniref:Uncharacterized protein n=1 Tax=Salpingoeca rosetta (strain ATCC 50818 / BSB-021) TaxID=946362 RepID=F2U1T7_SALR5|nr:uncharacterized protein PTSG_02304 [Salpingoeca rosetta]EGD81589.1 hypothetical protein PTSG_02304 [Salpingoeca rosetta]|eukprot:XP_004996793.1 hypothetical protein PTSG_02304 [Salpingoeca rosetta]